MNRITLIWAAGFCSASVAACAGGMVLQSARASRRIVVDRMTSVIGPYRASNVQERRRDSAAPSGGVSMTMRIEQVFGFEREKRAKNTRPFIHVAASTGVLAALACFLLVKMLGEIAAPCALLVWIGLTRLFYNRLENRYSATLFRQFPDALGMIVRAARVGVPLNQAVRLVADEGLDPTASEFRQLSEEIAIGRSVGDALRAMSARNGLAEYRFFATALSLQSQTGGGLAETLDTLADTIRKRVAARLRGHALASEARTSCYVLGALPFVVGGLLFVSDPAYMSVLFTTNAGLKLLGFAFASLSIGLYLMYLITKATLS